MELLGVLKELIPCLKGKWFIADGSLLGIIREGGLISYDDDIDIYIMEDTEIDLSHSILKKQKYYICDKIYHPHNQIVKVNTWLEYTRHIKNKNRKLNRPNVMALAGKDYKEKKIIPQFTTNHIDIFTLKKGEDGRYTTNWDNYYYTEEELQLIEDYTLGFKVFIPNNAEGVLERQYGKDWRVPKKDFKYY
tara:strand:+ start:77 stop:649 length:573 start_codon:yes stop_codon:yes gene_type:complete